MGTDDLGRDLFSGIIQGLRNSLLVGIGVTLIAYSIGIILGIISGFFGGMADHFLMKLSEIFMVMPNFLIVILSRSGSYNFDFNFRFFFLGTYISNCQGRSS